MRLSATRERMTNAYDESCFVLTSEFDFSLPGSKVRIFLLKFFCVNKLNISWEFLLNARWKGLNQLRLHDFEPFIDFSHSLLQEFKLSIFIADAHFPV
jgi:hypothetical protein